MKARTVLSVIISAVFLYVPCAFPQQEIQNRNQLAKFKKALEQDGFDVNTGGVDVWNLAADWCAKIPGVTSAIYFNNQPYLQFLIPKSAQDPDQLSRIFQLEENEAIVIIGLTPPPARYFSYTPFLASKVYPTGKSQILASLGDSLNNLTVKTIGPTPFNAPVALIFTPDQGTDARVRAALRSAGYPAAIINTLVFPASMLNLGYGESADDLTIVPRSAIWQDQAAGDSYMYNSQLLVFRVTPHTPADPNPFPAPELRIRGTGHTEMNLMNKLDQLRKGIIDVNSGLYPTDVPSKPTLYEGYDYIQQGIDPWGDGRDCFYVAAGYAPEMGTNDKITLAEGEFLVIYGPNHVATGKATYMNINIYEGETSKLSIGSLDDRDFPNTATPYLPANDPDADLMFAYKISRSCGDERNCLELSAPDGCTRLEIGDSTLLGIGIRTYLEPATKVGPAMQEMLYDRVIKFSKPSP
jgi:hypothetical protein